VTLPSINGKEFVDVLLLSMTTPDAFSQSK